eukprot:scaffold31667_cov62-Attheya_sp.AAC.2
MQRGKRELNANPYYIGYPNIQGGGIHFNCGSDTTHPEERMEFQQCGRPVIVGRTTLQVHQKETHHHDPITTIAGRLGLGQTMNPSHYETHWSAGEEGVYQ